jgi:hypothetical protein
VGFLTGLGYLGWLRFELSHGIAATAFPDARVSARSPTNAAFARRPWSAASFTQDLTRQEVS